MRKLYACAALAACTFFAQNSLAQNLEIPVEYMKYISIQQENITKKFLSYNSAASHGKRARKVEKLREKLMDEVQESKMNISSMPKLNGDAAYRDTAANFLKFYFNVLNDDYAKVVNMEEIAEQSYDEMEAYLMLQEQIDKKMEEANQRMKVAQKAFAAKYNINLIDSKDEMGEKMKIVGDVNDHYHLVYLTFFKPYLQEQNLVKSLGKGNVGGIEQDKNALLKYAQEALAKLETIKPMSGDASLKNACKQVLQFYVKEAGEYMKPVTEYFLVNERFESIKKDYEKKSSPSQADVDAYNKAVNDINAASGKYNDAGNRMNGLRSESLDNWNQAVNAFFDEHMPR